MKDYNSIQEEVVNRAREELKVGLAKCEIKHRQVFKLLYGRDGGRRKLDDAMDMSVDEVVDEIPAGQLARAMQQVRQTLEKMKDERQL